MHAASLRRLRRFVHAACAGAGELLVRYWAQPARGGGATAEGEGDPFAAPPEGVDPSASARLRQLARIRASRPVLLAGARACRRRSPFLRHKPHCTPLLFPPKSKGVATLLDDGRGDGTAAGLVHALRDWAGALHGPSRVALFASY